MKSLARLSVIGMLVALLTLIATGTATARTPSTSTGPHSTVIWIETSPDGSTRTRINVTVSGPGLSPQEIGGLRTGPASARSGTNGSPANLTTGQPKGAYLYCNKAYAFTDTNGTFTLQHRCGGTKPCTYQFHGTFNPGRDQDFIPYHDTFQFPFAMNGRTGIATFYMAGSFTISGVARP